jgi:hypothetical protein
MAEFDPTYSRTDSPDAASTKSYIGRYATGYNWAGAIDNVMVFNRALTSQEIAALYNGGNGTEDISGSQKQASYSANGWKLDTIEDLADGVVPGNELVLWDELTKHNKETPGNIDQPPILIRVEGTNDV